MFFTSSSCRAFSSLLLCRVQSSCNVPCGCAAPLLTSMRFAASKRGRASVSRAVTAAATKGDSTTKKRATRSRSATATRVAMGRSKQSDWPSVRKSAVRRATSSARVDNDDGSDETNLDDSTVTKMVEKSLDEWESTTAQSETESRKRRAATINVSDENETNDVEPAGEDSLQRDGEGEAVDDGDASRWFTTTRSKQRLVGENNGSGNGGEEEEDDDLRKAANGDDSEIVEGESHTATAAEESVTGDGDEEVAVASLKSTGTAASEKDTESKYLAIQYPILAEQYHAEKNQVPVQEVVVDSGKVAHWKCQTCAHEWKQAVFIRCVLRQLCPHCDLKKHPLLATAYPLLVREWDTDRNDPFIDPAKLPVTSNVSAHWICSSCRSPFEAKVKRRVNNTSRCPTCTVSTLQSSSVSNELIRLEWHPVKNGDLSLQRVAPTTHVWWLCSTCGFEWEASVVQRLRVRKTGACPQCRNCVVAK